MGRREGGWVGMIEEKEKGEETEGCKNWGVGKKKPGFWNIDRGGGQGGH